MNKRVIRKKISKKTYKYIKQCILYTHNTLFRCEQFISCFTKYRFNSFCDSFTYDAIKSRSIRVHLC